MKRFVKQWDESDVSDAMHIAHQSEKEVWEEVNCLNCANCCKKMTPTLTKTDRHRIATHLGLSLKAFKEQYLAYDKDDKDWRMQQQPCVFLNETSNMCRIYAHRPADCRGFPHLVKEPINQFAHIHQQNIKYCPATFLWVEKMMEKIEFNKH